MQLTNHLKVHGIKTCFVPYFFIQKVKLLNYKFVKLKGHL